jgi:hypothetical protein
MTIKRRLHPAIGLGGFIMARAPTDRNPGDLRAIRG